MRRLPARTREGQEHGGDRQHDADKGGGHERGESGYEQE
jgi:hypothetical protein